MTEYLRQEMLELGTDPEQFIREFKDWKSRGPAGEDDHYYFGKDGYYARPLVNGKHVLRHVHLVPSDDSSALAKWNLAWARRRKRVSDTAQLYADGGRHGYLLITILWEPTAHDIAEMRTQEDFDTMHRFAHVAEQFIFNGTIGI